MTEIEVDERDDSQDVEGERDRVDHSDEYGN